MYQSQVRPDSAGRSLVAKQQLRQHPGSYICSTQIGSAKTSLNSTLLQFARRGIASLIVCGAIAGCGGITYKNLGTTGSSQGNGVALSGVSCGTQSLTGAQSKTCSVSLSATALSSITVKLSSSNSALQIPASITIAIGQSAATFTAVTTGVSKSVNVTITASVGGVTKTAALTLYPTTASTPSLAGVTCATQSLTGPTTTSCSVSLSAAATSPTSVSLSSSNSALQVPTAVTVSSGSTSASFNVTASAVSSTQNVTVTAASGGVSQTYPLQLLASSGQTSQQQQHKVQLSWNAPSGSTIAGYNVYRAVVGVSNYALLTASLDLQTSFTDASVLSGSTYAYVVTSVDSAGMESSPSDSTQVSIP